MVDKIFLVKDRPTGFEETPSVIGFTTSIDEAKKAIEREKKNYQDAKIIISNLNRLRACFVEGIGAFEGEDLIPIPRWKSGIAEKEITPEMRAERTRIQIENEAIRERNANKFAERSKAIGEFLKGHLAKEIQGRENVMRYIDINDHFATIGINSYLHEDEPFFIEEVDRF